MYLFGPVWGASGVQGFFGEGYRFHKRLGPFKPDFSGMTFVAKTTTLHARAGNTPLLPDFTPRELMPKSVYVGAANFFRGVALNAWGLSGPGLVRLLHEDKWQWRTEPFMISFMTVADSPEERLAEVTEFSEILRRRNATFSTEVGIQLNLSCPNTDADTGKLVKEAASFLEAMKVLDRPVIVKISVDMPLVAVAEISEHKVCSALCVSNTVKFGKLPDLIPWKKYFGERSPLEKWGGGGLSGSPLLPITADYVTRLRSLGVTKHVNAGGGILTVGDAKRLISAGADSIFIGTMAMLRPWRVQKTIRSIKNLTFGR